MNKTTQITRVLSAGLLMAGLSLSVAAGAVPAFAAPAFAAPAFAARPAEAETPSATSGIEFKLSEAGGVYTVYMRPTAKPASPNATVSAQVTIKGLHGALTPSELTSLVAGTAWDMTSRNDAPAEASGSDYVSFSLDFPAGDYKAFNWAANTEQAIFTFKAAAGAHLMDSCDAFAAPNSLSASVGNEVTVLGFGSDGQNAYLGNYDQVQDCPSAAEAVSAVSLVAGTTATATMQAGGLITYTFNISNSGLRTANDLTLHVAIAGLANMQAASNSFGVANPVLYANQSATWHLSELLPNAIGTVTLTMVAPGSNDTLITTATISATNDNSATDNNAQLVVAVIVSAPSQPSSHQVYLPVIQR